MRNDISRWAVAALVALPTSLAAQTIGVAPFVSTNGSLPDSPTLVGASIASHAGVLAFRAGTGVDVGGEDFPLPGLADGWVADFDVNLAPMRLWKRGDGATGLEPALLFGVGFEGGRGDDDRFTVPNASYGGAVWYAPASWLRVESEARYRSPLGDRDALPAGVASDWEFRLGAMILWRRDPAPPVLASAPDRPRRARRPASRPDAPDAGPANSSGGNGSATIVTRNIAPATTTNTSLASSLLGTAGDYLGTSYRFGGMDPATGLDCSAFIQRVYRAHGITLPRTSRQQVQVGESVDADDLQPGDLLFFAGNGSRIDHVALYTGENVIIHSTSSGGGVVYDDLISDRGRWFREHLVAARRIIGTNLAAAAVIPVPADGELDPPDRAPARR